MLEKPENGKEIIVESNIYDQKHLIVCFNVRIYFSFLDGACLRNST